MDSERLRNTGRLEETRRKCQQLNARLEGMRKQIRDHLDPFEKIEAVNGAEVSALALEFADAQIAYLECLATIKALNAALGRG